MLRNLSRQIKLRGTLGYGAVAGASVLGLQVNQLAQGQLGIRANASAG